jgi:hypothetical protein
MDKLYIEVSKNRDEDVGMKEIVRDGSPYWYQIIGAFINIF